MIKKVKEITTEKITIAYRCFHKGQGAQEDQGFLEVLPRPGVPEVPVILVIRAFQVDL